MTAREIAAECLAALEDAPPEGLTSRELASVIEARHIDVIRVLRDDRRFRSRATGPTQHLRVLYSIRDGHRERLGAPRQPSHETQILRLLADGNWYSSQELYQGSHSIVHSRVAQLRKLGHEIEHDGGGPGPDRHFYRLKVAKSKANAA